MKTYGFGIDIGGTTIKMGLFAMTGALIDKWEIKTRTEKNGKYILDDIAFAVRTKMKVFNIKAEDIEGIGLGVPGPVGKDGTIYGCVNMGWGTFNVETELYKKIRLPVKAGNDANVAALGEMWQGGGKGYQDVVMITLGTGVGGGIIIDGKIVSGSHGASGEIGHIHVNDKEERFCGCKKRGCLEQYASATGIVWMAKQRLMKEHTASLLDNISPVTCKDIFDCAKQNDLIAIEIVEKACEVLGRSIATICNTIDPEVIVIGGGVSRAGSILTDTVEKYYQKYVFKACETTPIRLALLGNDAGMYGAVRQLF